MSLASNDLNDIFSKTGKDNLHSVLKDPAFKKYKAAIDVETKASNFASKSQVIKFDDKLKAMLMIMRNIDKKTPDMVTMKYVLRDLYWMKKSFEDPGQAQKAATIYGQWAIDCYNT